MAGNENAHYAALQQRVTGVENSLLQIATSVQNLSNKLDARSTTPWAVIATMGLLGVAVLGGFGKLAYDPIKDTQAQQTVVLDRLARKIDDDAKEIRENTVRTERDLREQIVPRREHERAWGLNDRVLEQLVKRLDRLEFPGRGS